MKKLAQQSITELKKKLAKKIKQLEDEIKTLPAYDRRKKDEKNWKTFSAIIALTALAGIYIFGIAGWLAAAATGTLLTLIIVESGLFLSIAIHLNAWPLYNIYLWTRDLFSSEKIKSQNKDYDQCHNTLIELKKLATKKNDLSTEISFKLNKAIKCFQSEFFSQRSIEFTSRDLNDQIYQLEQEKKKHPAHSRKQQAKHHWSNIFRYSAMVSVMGVEIYFFGVILMSTTLLWGPIVPVLMIMEAVLALLIIGPIMVSSLLHGTYLWMRDLFSAAEIKAENKQYAQLEKTIAELKILDKQQSKLDKLDEKITRKLHELGGVNLVQTTEEQEKAEKPFEFPEEKKSECVAYKLFHKPSDPANQGQLFSEQQSSCNLTSLRH